MKKLKQINFTSIKWLLLFLVIPLVGFSEHQILPDLKKCLLRSTHAIKGKIDAASGEVEITAVWKGRYKSKKITFPEFQEAEKMMNYIPPSGIQGWEVLIFLTADSINSNNLNPIDYFAGHEQSEDYRAFKLALSTFWLKEGEYFSFTQYDIPGPVEFYSCGKEEQLRMMVDDNISSGSVITKAKKKRNCKKKVKMLRKAYSNSTLFKKELLDVLVEVNCKTETFIFLETLLPKDAYRFEHYGILERYILSGEEQLVEKTDSIFDHEFNFWPDYIESNTEEVWWRYDSKHPIKFAYFRHLVFLLANHEIGNWQKKATLVRDYFKTVKNYDEGEGYGKIHESIDKYIFKQN